MTALTDKQRARQFREEMFAMLSQYELMRGLALISDIRVRKYLGLLEVERSKRRSVDEELRAVRKAVRQDASIETKARMIFDEDRELDLYVWGPLQLFFCVAWAYLDRYRYLRNRYPSLAFADLDKYMEENGTGLDAIKKLRDWVLHPGVGRRPDDAMVMLFSVRDGWRTAYPLDLVNGLVQLAGKFLEMLGEQVR